MIFKGDSTCDTAKIISGPSPSTKWGSSAQASWSAVSADDFLNVPTSPFPRPSLTELCGAGIWRIGGRG